VLTLGYVANRPMALDIDHLCATGVHELSSKLRKGTCFPELLDLRGLWYTDPRALAKTTMNTVSEKCGNRYKKTLTWLVKDGQTLPAFYDSPGEHRYQLLRCKPVRRVLAPVSYRNVRAK